MDDDRTIKLEYPIQAHGETVSVLTFPERILAGHLMATDEAVGHMQFMGLLIGAMCGLTPGEVRSMDARDFGRICDRVNDFLPGSPSTGGGSLPTSRRPTTGRRQSSGR